MSPNPYSDNTKGQTLDRNSEMDKRALNINEDSKNKDEPITPHASLKTIPPKLHRRTEGRPVGNGCCGK